MEVCCFIQAKDRKKETNYPFTGLFQSNHIASLGFSRPKNKVDLTDLVTVFDAILTSTKTREKLQCLYENLMSNNFRKTAVLNKI